MSLRIHLLRHGQTEHSRDNRFCGSGSDPELTGDGRRMAAAIAAALGGEPFSSVHSSPLRRARQTAAPLAQALGQQVEIAPGLAEIAYGAWEGLTGEEAATRFHDAHLSWSADPALHPPPGGETAPQVARRALVQLDAMRAATTSGDLLAISHKATIRIVLCALLGIDLGRFRQRFACPVGSLTTLEWNATGVQLLRLADRAHLPRELRDLPGT